MSLLFSHFWVHSLLSKDHSTLYILLTVTQDMLVHWPIAHYEHFNEKNIELTIDSIHMKFEKDIQKSLHLGGKAQVL